MPAFKLSSLLQKDKGSRRSSVASENSSIISDPDLSSPQASATFDGYTTSTQPAFDVRGVGATTDLSNRSDNTTRGLTLDTNRANLDNYSSDDNLDTPLASKNESDLFHVRSRSSTKGSNNGPSAQAILTQPIAVDGLGPAIPVPANSAKTVTPAQAIVIASQSTPPSGTSAEHTPSAGTTSAFTGPPMQSPLTYTGNTPPPPNPDIVAGPRSPTRARTTLAPVAPAHTAPRRASLSSKRPNPLNLVPGNAGPPLPTGSSLAPPTSSAQSVMSLPMPNTASASQQSHHDYPTSVPAEILSKVKSKVKGHRHHHRSSRDSESLNGHERKMGKRERLKSRLRASSDAFSTHSSTTNGGGGGGGEENTDSMGDESDSSDGSESDDELDDGGPAEYDDDMRSVATRSSYYSRASIPVHGFAVASNKRNLEFHALFPEIDEGDYLIEGRGCSFFASDDWAVDADKGFPGLSDYGCALQKDILLQGRIYVSEHHLSFHANIFGWITNASITFAVIIAFADVIAIEKKMTAFVIPNAISISTRQGKNYTFASFISRDSTYDVFINVWRQSHSRSPSIHEFAGDGISPDSGTGVAAHEGGSSAKPPATASHKPTQCACGQKGDHYTEVALETVLPSTPEKVYNLMFASSFLKDWMVNNQKLLDIQMGDWTPKSTGMDLLKRQMSYIKPLNGSIGPKQTKCEIADENEHVDYDQYICNITTTRTPDVPSGGAFSVKTRTCLMWNGANSTKVVVTTKVEFTARSFIKGIIEKSAIDGQKQYHNALETSMREYMKEHASEFAMQGADGKPIPEIEATDEAGGVGATNVEKSVLVQPDVAAARRKKEEEDASAFQYALDRIITGGKALGSGVWALVRWFGDIIGGLPYGKDLALVLVIGLLLASNLWTYKALKGSKVARVERRERRAAKVDTTPIGAGPADLQQMVDTAVDKYFQGSAESIGLGEASGTLGSYTALILQELNALENRIVQIRTAVVTADVVGEAGMVDIQDGQHPTSGAMDTLE
ncbi:hypothetical protein QFC22_003318 [Naganishia vaughanmartiniae]|uniref:Uncharacterized protein n=1 Tax=Naganishia vaughanmartiniae TaxID=1424756 RepID=A0ACC2X8D3_9TREE|nr:hypothetical protein QFC22_003318 [Naganishia vaughanmartiniae]